MRAVAVYARRHHIGLLALFVALGGTSYAATLPRNSVGPAQLKGGAVRTADIASNAVTGAKIRNDAIRSEDVAGLRASDFAPGELPAGAPGAAGATGPPGRDGAQGPAGPSASVFAQASFVAVPSTMLPGVIVEKAITVAGPSRLVIEASGVAYRDAPTGEGVLNCAPYVDPDGPAPESEAGIEHNWTILDSALHSFALAGSAPVPAGTHLVSLRCSDSTSQPTRLRRASLYVVATADAGD